jgi:FecR protein
MKTMTFTGRGSLSAPLYLAALLSLFAPMARAQDSPGAPPPPEAAGAQSEKDPPSRVARISFVEGSVSLQPGGQGDWGSAALNRPMTIGDKMWVDKDSRAELQTGPVAIHLGSMTALSFLNLDQGITQVRLAEGSINFRVIELREGDLCEVDAPNLAFTVKQAGAFRVDVNENGDATRVTVLRGEGEVTAGGKTYPVHSEERAEFTGTDNIESSINKAPGPDGLDRWAADRDLKQDNSVSGNYVSRDMPGYSDLDDHGTWRDEPEYGHVWYPNDVGPDWAPYSDGYWNYVGPWGWTWVDYSPWGFAPYHYGRWNYFAGGWGWCPGPIFGPPIYGPAFVGFFGGGFGFGVGWFPLGFGEPFFPWFHCRHEFFERINERNTFIRNRNVFNTNIRNVNFVNAHNVRAVTAVDRKIFMNGQAVNRGGVHLTPAALKGARVTNSVGIRPTQHSALGAANVRSHVATPPASVQNRAVVARTAPARAASHAPVHTVNPRSLTAGRISNSPVNSSANRPTNARPGNTPSTSGTTSRQRELSQSRPPSSATNQNRQSPPPAGNNTASQRAGNSTRTWEAQGNTTDRGRGPAGFGSSNRPTNAPAQTARLQDTNRPPWARGNSQSGSVSGQASRPSTPNYNSNRPNYSNNNRSYQPPQRTYSAPQRPYNTPQRTYGNSPNNGNRGYSQPRSYNPPPTRSYSAPRSYSSPSPSYSAPSRSYSAPSHSYSGGGGGSSGGGSRGGGGGGGSHSSGGGGGGGSHAGGGSASHGHR